MPKPCKKCNRKTPVFNKRYVLPEVEVQPKPPEAEPAVKFTGTPPSDDSAALRRSLIGRTIRVRF